MQQAASLLRSSSSSSTSSCSWCSAALLLSNAHGAPCLNAAITERHHAATASTSTADDPTPSCSTAPPSAPPRSSGSGPSPHRKLPRVHHNPGWQSVPWAARGIHTTTSSHHGSSQASAPSGAAPNVGGTKKAGAAGMTSLLSLNYASESLADLPPSAVVERLNRYIIGQEDAKRAVAVAFRSRWRRHRVPSSIKDDIMPKNILMIGPTGCGKTEIARRLAKLADAPFIKVEATKYTEVGFHGRDVDSIIKDLVEASITLVKSKLREQAQAPLAEAIEVRLLNLLAVGGYAGEDGMEAVAAWASAGHAPGALPPALSKLRDRLRAGELENKKVEVDLPSSKVHLDMQGGGNQGPVMVNIERLFAGLSSGSRKERKRMTVAAARDALAETEIERLFPPELITREAVKLAEQNGIVFIDEIDKIVSSSMAYRTGDPSSEGVQRDLLPIIEGSTVQTKHGNVNTDHILFIASGAFHSVKPSDLMAELQGRLPIRVELKGLSAHDFYRILTEPQYNLITQQKMLLSTEGVDLHFTDAAIREVARLAEEINRSTDNIGARRLMSVLERCVEQISFSAPELVAKAKEEGRSCHIVVDKENVLDGAQVYLQKSDFARWII